MDNIGSIIAIDYIRSKQIEHQIIAHDQTLLLLKAGSTWQPIPLRVEHIDLTLSIKQEAGNTLYTIKGVLKVPLSHKDAHHIEQQLKDNTVILRCLTANGTRCYYGDMQHPIHTHTVKQVGNRPQDLSYVQISINGLLLHDSLVL